MYADKIIIDESSRNDYRLRLENKYLRKFLRYFDTEKKRENIEDLTREFREELIEKEIVKWERRSSQYFLRSKSAASTFSVVNLVVCFSNVSNRLESSDKNFKDIVGYFNKNSCKSQSL